MNGERRFSLRLTVILAGAVAMLAIGAGAAYFILRRTEGVESVVSPESSGPVKSTPTSPSKPSSQEVVIALSEDLVERAGIVAAPVGLGRASALRLPGVVEPNAYRRVPVTPLVSGRITRVNVELGEAVRQGQTLAEVFSPELAEARTRFVSMRAELEAHERELQRTEKLAAIGAASREELERVHARHTAILAETESARSRLELLGVPASASENVSATSSLVAPISGVVIERFANVGLNVDPASTLFTIVDLATVWVIADLYEKDFSLVRVGSLVTITATAYPDVMLEGKVSYIDPQVRPETRTARLRVEVPNTRGDLRLGMFVDVLVKTSGMSSMVVVPKSALQVVGDRHVVYVVSSDERGKFHEREIRLGQASGEQVEVLSGLEPGEIVVTEGSFFLRAERERLGLAPPASPSPPIATVDVIVGERGYEPERVRLHAGVPARIVFTRTTDKTCGTEVVIPSLNIRRELPLNEPVAIEFTPQKNGDVAFGCGMNMLRGAVIVE